MNLKFSSKPVLLATYTIFLLSIALILSCSRKVKDPCFTEWGCEDCTSLFDKMQKNLNNPETLMAIQECYDRVCK